MAERLTSTPAKDNHMKHVLTAILLLAANSKFIYAQEGSNESPIVARVLQKTITAKDIGLGYDANNRPVIPNVDSASCIRSNSVEELQTQIIRAITSDYIDNNHLRATDEEIREFEN